MPAPEPPTQGQRPALRAQLGERRQPLAGGRARPRARSRPGPPGRPSSAPTSAPSEHRSALVSTRCGSAPLSQASARSRSIRATWGSGTSDSTTATASTLAASTWPCDRPDALARTIAVRRGRTASAVTRRRPSAGAGRSPRWWEPATGSLPGGNDVGAPGRPGRAARGQQVDPGRSVRIDPRRLARGRRQLGQPAGRGRAGALVVRQRPRRRPSPARPAGRACGWSAPGGVRSGLHHARTLRTCGGPGHLDFGVRPGLAVRPDRVGVRG